LALFQSVFDDDKQKNVANAAASEIPSESLAQSSVVTGTYPQGAFVVITLNPKVDLKEVAQAAAKLPKIIQELTPEDYQPKLGELAPILAGVGFGTGTYEQLCKATKKSLPSNFTHFTAKKGQHGDMPSTGGDILLHVKAETVSLCYEVVKKFVETLPKGSIKKVEDKYSFQFQDGRDLSGFLDGTENPADNKSRREAALLPTGGSYVIHQKWIHNIPMFESKPISEQEKIVGRTKPDSAELSKKVMPKTSHVARMRDENFQKIPIVRQSMPFGTVGGERGLLFIAYSNNPANFDKMLDRMVGKQGGSENDAIMSFSNCVASQYFYVPSAKELSSF